jgi:coenzyme F420-0:L-glutamate ligase / coenzyme F420-1:gamma-L-glutamate ligase
MMDDHSPRVDLAATIQTVAAGRRSVRRYAPCGVAADIVRRLLLVATSAPSAHNRQPWRFVVIEDAAGKRRLAAAMGARLEADRRHDGDDEQAIARDVERSFERISGAPLVILVCMTLEDMDGYPDARRGDAETVMAIQSTAMASQNLLLAAHAEGLGACWMCAPLFCPETVRATLSLDPRWAPQGLVTVGWPGVAPRPKPRLPLEAVVVTAGGPR